MPVNNLIEDINKLERGNIPDTEIWHHLYKNDNFAKDLSIEEQKNLYDYVYRNRERNDPGPVWLADDDDSTNVKQTIADLSLYTIHDLYEYSNTNLVNFYEYIINKLEIVFANKYSQILDESSNKNTPNWLCDAKLNIVDSCFLANKGSNAITYDHNGHIQHLTYDELEQKVHSFSSNLINIGVVSQDKIGIFMPMNIDAIVAYLAIMKIGAIAVSIADSFSSNEIQLRLDISESKHLITQKTFIRAGKTIQLYAKTKELENIRVIVIAEHNLTLHSNDILAQGWDKDTTARVESVPSSAHTPINILFSSGTTGSPKAIPWDHTTVIKAAIDGYFNQDIQPRNIIAWPTNLGWMMGPWLVFATLINKGCIAISQHIPTSINFCQFIEETKVNILGVVPSIVSHWKANNSLNNLDFSSLKLFTSTGESSNPEDMFYLIASANYKPVIEYCGGTEIGGAYVSGTLLNDCIPATFPMANFATKLALLDENGLESDHGELVLIPPTLGLSKSLLNKDHFEVYFQDMPLYKEGLHYRRHGDEFVRLANGYYRTLGRCDDTMNLGAIKTSSAEIERCFTDIEALIETAAIASTSANGGPSQLIVFCVTIRQDTDILHQQMQIAIKQRLNPLFKIYKLKIIDKLPRTSSNKIMRRVLRDMLDE